MRDYSYIESFSGPGGLSLGLERAGFLLALAFDSDGPSIETFRRNISDRGIVAKAEDLTATILRKQAGLRARLDLFAGGPPCQGFSKQKRGAHRGDERNKLILGFARLAHDLEPRFFLLENVAIFGQKRGRRLLEKLAQRLEQYNLYPHFYNCADYGLAQTRERFILIGMHRSISAPFRIPKPTVDTWRTVGDVLDGLPEPPEDYTDHPNFPNHQRARVTPINIKRFSFVPQGGGWQDIPEKYRLECHKGVDTSSGGWPDVYGRLRWDGQCPTITGGFDSFTRGRYGHPLQDRPLTPREAARLQGFPDEFVFCGTRADIRSQIGNAVPPPLAEAIGKEIMRSLRIADGDLEPDADEIASRPRPIQCGGTAMEKEKREGFDRFADFRDERQLVLLTQHGNGQTVLHAIPDWPGRPGLTARILHMYQEYGLNLPHRRCKTCRHLERTDKFSWYTHFKCRAFVSDDEGASTDWRLKWPACGLWEARGADGDT